jgi:hypothetical protein
MRQLVTRATFEHGRLNVTTLLQRERCDFVTVSSVSNNPLAHQRDAGNSCNLLHAHQSSLVARQDIVTPHPNVSTQECNWKASGA